MADAPNKDLIQKLKELLVTVQKQADEKAQEAAAEQARQNQVARQESVQEQMPSLVFMTWDLDSAGNAVARAERTDDPDKVADVSQRIDSAQNVAKNWIIARNGRVVQAGGDEGMGQVSSELIPEMDELRKEVREASGFTITIGVGPKISNAINARMLGKLTGKNQVKVWDESTDRELEARLLAQGDEESKKIAEAIAEPVKKSESSPKTPKHWTADELIDHWGAAQGETHYAQKWRAAQAEGKEPAFHGMVPHLVAQHEHYEEAWIHPKDIEPNDAPGYSHDQPMRDDSEEEWAQDYAKRPAETAPPVILRPSGKADQYKLVDGRHRTRAAAIRGGKVRAAVPVKKSFGDDLAVEQEAADQPVEKTQALNVPANLVGESVEQRDDAVEKLKLPKWSPPQK